MNPYFASNRLKTLLSFSALIIFIMNLERFYTEALTYQRESPPAGVEVQTLTSGVHRVEDSFPPVRPPTVTSPPSKGNSGKENKEKVITPQRLDLKGLFGITVTSPLSKELKMPPQPLPVVAPPPSTAPERPPQMVLKGIILEPDGDYRAYIEIDGKRVISLRRGEGIDDITATDIRERSVEIRWKEETLKLSIDPRRH